MIQQLKSLVEKIPYPVGSILAKVPFSWRLGRAYSETQALIDSGSVNRDYVIARFNAVFQYAKVNIPFYRELYESAGVLGLEIKTLSDIEKVPVVTKSMLRKRHSDFDGALGLNTGGTSGEPFAFYVDSNAFAREWAHMHAIWARRGYNYQHTKLTLRGKNLGEIPYQYNAVHNEFIVNTYLSLADFYQEILALVEKHSIQFLHGYPSTIYSFLKELEDCCTPIQRDAFRRQMKSCLLGSEFPQPYMVDYITREWGLEYISWYGHSEMCVLAFDPNSDNQYLPFHSYGYVEVQDEHLIGTSYHNYDMPLIRYDTGDLVEANYDNEGILAAFSIKHGRSGDYIVDNSSKNIPLTGLIFGRHHKAFTYLRSVQVRQSKPGHAELLVTLDSNDKQEGTVNDGVCYDTELLLEMFDLSNIDIDFNLSLLEKPILSKAGKMPLLVRD